MSEHNLRTVIYTRVFRSTIHTNLITNWIKVPLGALVGYFTKRVIKFTASNLNIESVNTDTDESSPTKTYYKYKKIKDY